MSDGPYKTLPMKPRWKAVAKAAYLEAYEANEVVGAVATAVLADYRTEVSGSFASAVARLLLSVGQLDLFPGQQIANLEALHVQCGSPMETSLLLNAKQAIIEGCSGNVAMQQAVEDTLAERCLSASRQVEEHMFREASTRRADIVRSRMESAICETDIPRLAKEVLRSTDGRPRSTSLRYDGLDDGVSL